MFVAQVVVEKRIFEKYDFQKQTKKKHKENKDLQKPYSSTTFLLTNKYMLLCMHFLFYRNKANTKKKKESDKQFEIVL